MKIRKGRDARGEQHGQSKLTEAQVLEIRQRCAQGERQEVLAREFGVSRPNISVIRSGRSWRHLAEILQHCVQPGDGVVVVEGQIVGRGLAERQSLA